MDCIEHEGEKDLKSLDPIDLTGGGRGAPTELESNTVPKWLRSRLSHQTAQDISLSIQRLEAHTDVEVVPMIVRESKRAEYSLIAYFMFAFAILGVFSCLINWRPMFDSWITGLCMQSIPIGCSVYAGGGLCALIIGVTAFVMSRFNMLGWLKVLLEDVEQSVFSRAMVEFYHHNLDETSNRTAVLFFVSLKERRAVILADKGVASHFSENTWISIVDRFTVGLRKKNFGEKILEAIDSIGKIVSEVVPKTVTNTNEIRDALIFPEDR